MSPQEPRIVFFDTATYGDTSLQRFTEQWDCPLHALTGPAETIARIAGHSILVTNKVAVDKALLGSLEARDLRLIAVAATGTDIIDREQAAKRGVKVCNVPGYATQSVAQFTLALLLELATKSGKYVDAVKAGEWQKSSVFSLLTFPTIELSGKKLGIIGFGSIGQAVAQMAQSFGMEILISARPGSGDPAPPGRIPVERLLRDADVVSLHCPLTPKTRRLINARSLALMKPTAFLINTARGALVDEAALIEALSQRRIAAAALDVLTEEPPPDKHPLLRAALELDNLLITPHTAWSAHESRERLLREVEENIAAFLQGRERNLVV